MKAYVDGKFVTLDDAAISIHDAGVQHGVGLFETMQAFNGRVFRLEAHLQRLIDSAATLGLSRKIKLDPLAEVVERTLKQNDLTEARVRLTVTGGDLSLLSAARNEGKAPAHQPSIICVVTKPTEYPAEFFEQGVTAVIADAKLNPFDPTAGHKTLNYWSRLRALADAAAAKAGEALWFTVTNHLAEGSVSNVFLAKDGKLSTPIARGEEVPGSLPSAVLAGITRAAVMEIAEKLDIAVERRMPAINDLLEAEEVFLTNSSWQVLPVVKVEKETVGGGEVGPMTRQLRGKLLELIAEETGGVVT